MSQDLIAISKSGLRIQLPIMNDGALYDVVGKIKEWRKLYSDQVEIKTLADVIEKEKMILAEIVKRIGITGESAEAFLMKIPDDALRQSAYDYDLSTLKNLYFRIILWKRRNGDKAPTKAFYMMLRKESIIHRELTRRGLTKELDFKQWKDDLQRRLTKDGRIYRGGRK